jgi:hypothetical protein
MVTLYVGLAFGSTLILQYRSAGPTPSVPLHAFGLLLLVVGVVVPPVLVVAAARQLSKHWVWYTVVAVLFCPIGTFIAAVSLWETRRMQSPPQSRAPLGQA